MTSNSDIIGYNYYINGVLANTIPQPDVYTFEGLNSDTDYHITATAVNSAGLESDPSASLNASTQSVNLSGSPLNATDSAAVDAIVATGISEGCGPGVVVGINSPRGYYVKAYGSGVTTDDHYRIGSVTKTFTATAILMQVQAGTLSLDDRISSYVPGLPNGNSCTIRDLMKMQSGMPDDQGNFQLKLALLLNPTGGWSPQNTLAYVQSQPAMFTPGSSYYYTNTNYILLGMVVTAITGRAIRDVIIEDIITPLGMTETTWPTSAALPAPHSEGYWLNPLTEIPLLGLLFSDDITSMNPEFFDAAGALTSTIGDMIKWGDELRDSTLLNSETDALRKTFLGTGPGVQPWTGPQPPLTFEYGLGMIQIGSWMGHDGSEPGFDGLVMFEPESQSVIAIWENMQTPGLKALVDIWFQVASYLLPTSTVIHNFMVGGTVTQLGISSEESFGIMNVIHWQARGDGHGNISLPHQVPFVIWSLEVIEQAGIPSAEAFGRTVSTGGDTAQDVAPNGIASAEAFGTVQVASTVENITLTNQPVPMGATGCYITLIGGGSAGGASGQGFVVYGGSGGGGGGGIERTFIPASLLGQTYSITRGLGGVATSQAGGTASVFTSGSVSLSAGGGGVTAGGTCTVTGVTAVTHNGGNGGSGNTGAGAAGQNSTGNAGAGGGGAGGTSAGAGGNGGSSSTITGAAAQATPSNATPGNGGAGGGGGNGSTDVAGAGGNGGLYGGGGGGGGAGVYGGNWGGSGGDGYTLVEWV